MATALRLLEETPPRIPLGSLVHVKGDGEEFDIVVEDQHVNASDSYSTYLSEHPQRPEMKLTATVWRGRCEWELDGDEVTIEVLRPGWPAVCDVVSHCPETGFHEVCEPVFIEEITDPCGCTRAVYQHQCSVGRQVVDLWYCEGH